jgi:hypothetical protein
LGCWISPCYGPFSLGARFETYEPFISLIFQFFSGRSKQRITETADMDVHLYNTNKQKREKNAMFWGECFAGKPKGTFKRKDVFEVAYILV